MARYHPFFERVGFRYLFDTASGRPVLAYPLTEEAEGYLSGFLKTDPHAQAHGGRLYRPRFGRVAGLKEPIRLHGVHKGYRSLLDLEGLSPEVQEALLAFGVRARRVERAVLRGVELEIPPRSLVVLSGASGAGKTTLLRLLLGEPPDLGEVEVPAGKRVAYIPGEKEVGLGEDPILERLYQDLGDVGAAIEVLNRVGLSDAVLYRARPQELSTGQRERFRLALLLGQRPDLLHRRVRRPPGRPHREEGGFGSGKALPGGGDHPGGRHPPPRGGPGPGPGYPALCGLRGGHQGTPERSTKMTRPGRRGTTRGFSYRKAFFKTQA